MSHSPTPPTPRCFFSGIFRRIIGTVKAAIGIRREGGRVTMYGFGRTVWWILRHYRPLIPTFEGYHVPTEGQDMVAYGMWLRTYSNLSHNIRNIRPRPRGEDRVIGQPKYGANRGESAGQTKPPISGVLPASTRVSPLIAQPHRAQGNHSPASLRLPRSPGAGTGACSPPLADVGTGVLYLEYSPPTAQPPYIRNIRSVNAW